MAKQSQDGRQSASKPGAKEGKLVTDSRFAAVHYDPRFQRFPKAKGKVEIDNRFAGMFKDPSFQVKSVVDKRGRKAKGVKKGEDMRRYYRLRDEHEEEAKLAQQGEEHEKDGADAQAQEAAPSDEEARPISGEFIKGAAGMMGSVERAGSGEEKEEGSDEGEDEEKRAAERWARIRGLAGPEESSSEEEEGEEEDDDEVSEEEGDSEHLSDSADVSNLKEWGVGAMAANPDEQIPLSDATARLAVVDLDWAYIRAVDILVVLRSFLPKGGKVEQVTVYVSDYGLQKMAEESTMGPQGIWKSKQAGAGAAQEARGGQQEAGSEDEGEETDSETGPSASEAGSDGDDDGGEVDQRQLQLYERSKLRWYYAVVKFNSVETASHIYDNCDGIEFLKSACRFDLRFIPEGQSFEGRQVRDSASDVPPDYEPPTFQTKALQHTNVSLTWDADDEGRKRALTKKMTADDIKDDDFVAYLASDTEDSDEEGPVGGEGEEGAADEAAAREQYRRLLLGAGDMAEERKGKKDWGADEDEPGSEGKEGSSSEEEGEEGPPAGPKTRVKNDKGMEMEVTFVPGLENLGERLLAKKKESEAQKGETVWEAYLRRRREKRREAKRLGKKHDSDEDDESEDDYPSGSDDGNVPADVKDDPFFQREENPFDDPFFNQGSKDVDSDEAAAAAGRKKDKAGKKKEGKAMPGQQQKRQEEEEERRKRAELEMLLMDETALAGAAAKAAANSSLEGAKPLSKKERMRLKKEAKRRERTEGSDDEDMHEAARGFKVDLADPRFQDMFSSHHFALDPTDPRYAKMQATQAIVTEAAKRRNKAGGGATLGGGKKSKDGRTAAANGGAAADDSLAAQQKQQGSGNGDLQFMVASLKRKSTQMLQQGGTAAGATAHGAGKAAKDKLGGAAQSLQHKKKKQKA